MIIREMEITADTDTTTDNQPESDTDLNFVWTPLEDELTGASLKKLKSLLTATNVAPGEVEKFLKDLPGQTTINVLQSVLMSESFRNWITKQ